MSCTDQSRSADAQTTAEEQVLRQLRSLRFGQLTVMVHDGRIVQVDRTERLRTVSRHHQTKPA
jgi:hypothetical protein